MHRKRVTCELHDSYFRWMTTNHAIPKIEWALNYYITQSRQKSRQLQFKLQLEMRCGRESHTRPKELVALMSWGPEKMLIRRSKESHHPAEWASGPPVEHQENEKDTTLPAIRVKVKILTFLFGLQLPLTRKPWITFWNPYNKVRGTYIYKEVFERLFIIVLLWCCRWQYNIYSPLFSQHLRTIIFFGWRNGWSVGLRSRSKLVRTQIALLLSISD